MIFLLILKCSNFLCFSYFYIDSHILFTLLLSVARNFLSKKTELLQNNGKTDILPQNNGKTDFLAEKNGKRTKFRSSKKRSSFFGTSSGNTAVIWLFINNNKSFSTWWWLAEMIRLISVTQPQVRKWKVECDSKIIHIII